MGWVGHVGRMGGGKRTAYRVLVCKPEGERPLGGPRIILRLILKKWGFCALKWINLADDMNKWRAVLNVLTNFCFHKMREIYLLAKNVRPCAASSWIDNG
jgi:hypothetical protein